MAWWVWRVSFEGAGCWLVILTRWLPAQKLWARRPGEFSSAVFSSLTENFPSNLVTSARPASFSNILDIFRYDWMKSEICRKAWWIACICLDGLSGPWFHLHQFLRWMVSTSVILQNCWKELYIFFNILDLRRYCFHKTCTSTLIALHPLVGISKVQPLPEVCARMGETCWEGTKIPHSIHGIHWEDNDQDRCIIQDEVVAEPGETLYDEVCTAWQSAWPARTMESTCCLPPCHNQSCSWNKMIWLYSNGYGGSQTICASRTKRCVPFDLTWFTVCIYMFMFSCSTQTVNLKVHGQDGTAMKFPDRDGIERQVRLIKPGSPVC